MEEITVQQQQAAQMLAETSHKIGSYLQFDKTGAPSQDGKIVLTVRAAHGLLHLDPHHPPSPYAVISIDQQVHMTAVAPDTRNPIWEKECVFDVPNKPGRIVVSVLDRTILGSGQTVLLGKAHIALNLLTDTDMEDWHDLTTDEFGMVRQHAGSVRVKRRFVPTRAWGEYLKNRSYKANLAGMPDELVESQEVADPNIYGLYIMVLQGEGLSSGVPLQNVMTYLQLDQGTNMAESTKHRLSSNITFGKSKDEVCAFRLIGGVGDGGATASFNPSMGTHATSCCKSTTRSVCVAALGVISAMPAPGSSRCGHPSASWVSVLS
jgi:hypothetical protein